MLALVAIAVLATITGCATTQNGPARGTTTIPTYVGDLTYQHQTLSKPSAEKLHRQMALARASELVVWSMPAMNFYQALEACQQN